MTVTIVAVSENALSCISFSRIPYMDMNCVVEVACLFFAEIIKRWPGHPGAVHERDDFKPNTIFANRQIFV
jgi:hypothetical protein